MKINKNGENINTFSIKFSDILNNNDNLLFHFIGKSITYEKSYLYGEVLLDLMDNKLESDNNEIWNYEIKINLDKLHYKLNGVLERSSNTELNIIDLWNKIFNEKKITKSLNTVDSKNLNKEYEYIIHTKNTLLNKENIEIHIYGENYNWDYIPLIKENKETEDLELTNYFPEEIINKTYYFDLFDFINQRNYISTFSFKEDKLIEIFYKDNTLTEIDRSDEYSKDKFLYNTQNKNLILDIDYDEPQYIIPARKQGIYNKKITNLRFEKNFTEMYEYDRYMEMKEPELNAFKTLLESNGWIVNLDEKYAQTGEKFHTLNLPGEIKGIFPAQIINKTFYAWVYDNINEQYYLSTYIFEKDKLMEIFYVDQTLTDYVQLYEYQAVDSIFDSSKQQLILEISYDTDQYIIPSNNQGRFRKKVKRITFNQDFSTLTEVDRFLDMYAPEIAAFIPLITLLGWAWSEDDLWVEFSWLAEGEKFIQTIPEKPVLGQDTLDEASNIQCLNVNLTNTFAIQKENDKEFIVFNNVPYNLYEYIGLNIGSYTLSNISKENAIGFVINDTSKFEITSGTEVGIKIIEGKFVMHYYDTVQFKVKKDFGTISYSSYTNGYMGGENRLKFNNTC